MTVSVCVAYDFVCLYLLTFECPGVNMLLPMQVASSVWASCCVRTWRGIQINACFPPNTRRQAE